MREDENGRMKTVLQNGVLLLFTNVVDNVKFQFVMN